MPMTTAEKDIMVGMMRNTWQVIGNDIMVECEDAGEYEVDREALIDVVIDRLASVPCYSAFNRDNREEEKEAWTKYKRLPYDEKFALGQLAFPAQRYSR